MLAAIITVRGRVQGVGFRWWAGGVARQLNLSGHVENLPDGQVEIRAQGEPDSVRMMLRYAIEQPTTTARPGRVEDYDLRWVDVLPTSRGFGYY